MKQSLLALAAASVIGAVTRARTCDVAFTYRMDAGYPGDVNRTHPFSVVAGMMNATDVVRRYGDPVLFGTANDYRGFKAADQSSTALKIAGVLVRPYPTQQQSGGMTSTIGAATPLATSGVHDFLEDGFIMTKLPAAQVVKKGDAVFVWCTADAGGIIQGGFTNVASAGNTVPVTNAIFWGPADANGNVEIRVRQA